MDALFGDRLNKVFSPLICIYDGTWKGKLQYVANPTSRTDYLAYDVLGRATQSRQTMFGRSYDVFYGYDLTGALTTETYPSGRVIATGYDRAGRSLQVQCPGVVYAQNVAFAPHGAATSRLMANGALQETMSYTGGLQPASKLLQKVTPLTTHWQQQLYYHTNGNVQYHTLQPLGVNQFYYYDNLNRLYYEEEPSGTYVYRQYGFDAYGNRWVQAYAGVPLDVYTPTAQAQINAANNRLVMTGVSFDAAGNQTLIRNYAATYDAENRLRTVGTPIGTITSDYDGEWRRVRKSSGVEAVYFVYDIFGRVIAEYGGQVAVTGRKFLTVDHLGSTRVVTNASGDIVARHDYFAYGEEYPLINGRTANQGYQPTIKERRQLTGKERDQESGLDNFLARFYAPILGRFTSPDKPFADQHNYDPQSWNLYAYAGNNPLRFIDTNGRVKKDANGNVIFERTSSGTVTFMQNAPVTIQGGSAGTVSVTWQADLGNIFADNGTAI